MKNLKKILVLLVIIFSLTTSFSFAAFSLGNNVSLYSEPAAMLMIGAIMIGLSTLLRGYFNPNS